MSPSLAELEAAARDVIRIMKTVPGLSEQHIAVIGGMALWKYLPRGRSTEDVDFIITLDGPKSIKPRLLALNNSPFVEYAQWFYYKTPNDRLIQIDFVGHFQAAYFPPTAQRVKDIPEGTIPYITPSDLIVSKIFSCGLRGDPTKSRRDAADAENLLNEVTKSHGPLILAPHQLNPVQGGLPDVIRQTDKNRDWWMTRLGLVTPSNSTSESAGQTSGGGSYGGGSSRGSGGRESRYSYY
ncbi:uncharacterized protein F4817DRAFT_115910 [Daldinia loculata]|uniref:uncharacterized protein n=1 Tax=Daldinia loculata TaxID=103429 RepID=UPI0020C1C11C|nr:uncharacterized protein F4817DRAFT_115910 [Daldinia loculata]KAI1647086.1 hypothetical protein F4817DRAFT_115910 [Daldinia loculata]